MKRPELIQNIIEDSTLRFGNKTALVCENTRYSYVELHSLANRWATTLVNSGLQAGDRVLIALDNSLKLVTALFGIAKAGGIYVVINPALPVNRLSKIIQDCQPAVIITGERLSANMKAACQLAEASPIVWYDEPEPGDNPVTLQLIPTPDALASIVYTSGTTGDPKGVMLTHRQLLAAAIAIETYLENTADDVVLCVLPLFFSYGLLQLYVTFMTGATLVLEKNFAFPARSMQLIEQEKVTGFAGVPTIYSILLQQPGLKSMDLSSLRYLTNAGSGMPPALYRQLRQAIPAAALYLMYGQTECPRIAYTPPSLSDRFPEAVALPVPGLEAWLVDEKGNRLADQGSQGELVVKAPFVSAGYWNKPEETAAKFSHTSDGDSILHTGDIFRTDQHGYFYFVSRKDDIIKSRGEKVPPRLVEDLLTELPQVLEVAVIGLPDPILGEAVSAYIVLRSDHALSEQEVRAYCSRHLENFMCPKFINFVTDLPKTHSGKIARRELKDRVLSGLKGEAA